MKKTSTKKLTLSKIKIAPLSNTGQGGIKGGFIVTLKAGCSAPGDTVCYSDFQACNTVNCE